MLINGWVKLIEAEQPKTSKKARTEWVKELTGTKMKNGLICVDHKHNK